MAAAPKGDAAIALEVVAKGDDPFEGARVLGKAKQAETITINGLPAARAVVPIDGRAHAEVTWIAHGGLIFQLVAIASTEQFKTFQPEFGAVAASFRPLSAHERAGITETQIRLITAYKNETMGALTARAHSAWRVDQIAVANGLDMDAPLRERQGLKVAIEERYETRKSNRCRRTQ